MMQREQGFSLIEVMVAVLIVAVGILGVAGMQVVSLQQNRNALLRDQALQLGNDILDRMRANPLTAYATEASPVELDDEPSASLNCIDEACNRNEMAEFDIAQWKCSLNPLDEAGEVFDDCEDFGIVTGTLPEGKGGIAKSGSVYEITVQWVNDREGNTSSIILRSQTEEI